MKKYLSAFSITVLAGMLSMNVALAQNTEVSSEDMKNLPGTIGNYTIRPAEPNAIKPTAIMAEMKPGDTYSDNVLVTNKSEKEITVSLHAADGTTTNTGSFTIKSGGEPQENIGLWTTIEHEPLVLGPGEEKKVFFSITVPEDTALGEYKGGIAAQQKGEERNSIITSTRVVTPVLLTVTDNPQPIPKLQDGEVNIFNPTPFFWGTVVIFVGSMGYLVYANKKEKQKGKNRV